MDLGQVKECPKPGKLHVVEGELIRIAKGLLARNLVRPVLQHELIMVAGKPLFNAFFGVGKGKYLPDDAPEYPGAEILRFIMNLTCTNSLCVPFKADIGALPFYGQWKNIIVDERHDLSWSYDDMKGCFYLFAMPGSWAPYFCFRHAYTAGELGVVGLPESTPLWLGATTVPMGFCNAMGIIQYAHRRVHIGPQAGSLPSLPLSREIRKDHAVPPLKAHAPALQEAWSVYCDDADVPRVTVPTGDS